MRDLVGDFSAIDSSRQGALLIAPIPPSLSDGKEGRSRGYYQLSTKQVGRPNIRNFREALLPYARGLAVLVIPAVPVIPAAGIKRYEYRKKMRLTL